MALILPQVGRGGSTAQFTIGRCQHDIWPTNRTLGFVGNTPGPGRHLRLVFEVIAQGQSFVYVEEWIGLRWVQLPHLRPGLIIVDHGRNVGVFGPPPPPTIKPLRRLPSSTLGNRNHPPGQWTYGYNIRWAHKAELTKRNGRQLFYYPHHRVGTRQYTEIIHPVTCSSVNCIRWDTQMQNYRMFA